MNRLRLRTYEVYVSFGLPVSFSLQCVKYICHALLEGHLNTTLNNNKPTESYSLLLFFQLFWIIMDKSAFDSLPLLNTY